MTRLRFTVAYEGGAYSGWQRQSNALCIQQVIEEALERVTREALVLRGAGRTDAGVHAAGQVFIIDSDTHHDASALQKSVNAVLPEDIVLRSAEVVAADFDPRRAALGKHYRYTIHQGIEAPLFHRRLRWHFRKELDWRLMESESQCLVGQLDFSSFRGAGCGARNPVRRLDRLSMRRQGACLYIDVVGQSFLKHMVRNIVGSLVELGRGFRAAGWLAQVLDARDRPQAGGTAPAMGLCLMRVFYDSEAYAEACAGQGLDRDDLFHLL